ncbi:hypothetical protein AV530_009057 [Patagioenas fasciata monilis]|uniref:Uncharacterized protein n=1 Tax=Patagioenas fasciata monilis TaxID=372326 RepID=A0A1V4K7I0_PATFA|nr:hypothetical protein AV530_009057 [Patagioenas fasciata monilis]
MPSVTAAVGGRYRRYQLPAVPGAGDDGCRLFPVRSVLDAIDSRYRQHSVPPALAAVSSRYHLFPGRT